MENKKIFRIIDANLNRSREGLRVCEDITRFLLNDAKYSRRLKLIRQMIFSGIKNSNLDYAEALKYRDSRGDVGKPTTTAESKRTGWQGVFLANIERAKESTRVLEEASKLIDKKLAQRFKKIRYQIYGIEKAIITKHLCLPDSKHKR
ncbi:MAG: thiamine-phosphate pyrophosphorylase [Candidatus Omnitrophica bacterium]|nr:thiamine-phosphate pyrophosphorylase [Candidatus Omnitrophota bacterium]